VCEHTFVRWDNLTIEAQEGTALPGYREPAIVRHFDAPEALDTRFYEVRSKSALNRVPERSRMPFRWTINPYRGCSHACTYCLSGDTPILMADGTTRPIATLREGDAIYGTESSEGVRRFVRTEVLAQWATVKAAYNVTLDGGRQLVASADHRFLTAEGWEHVCGADSGRDRRPHLRVGSGLVGEGAIADGSSLDLAGREVPRALSRVAAIVPLPSTSRLYDITTGTGDFIANGVVSHNCFARPTHTYLDFNAGRDFEKEIVVKVNVPEVLRVEMARPSWKGEHVAMGTNTDPYQWVEGRYKLMRGIWEVFRDAANPCSVLTKSPLLLRDLDLMKEIAAVTDISANLSIPTIDEKAWRASEPHTPNPRARLEAVGELNRAGIPTGILVAPLMPGINDDPAQVQEILQAAADAGATGVSGIGLHLRGEVRGVFMDWLRSYRPDLIERYEELYARSAYLPRVEQERLGGLVRGARARTVGAFRREPGRGYESMRAGISARERPARAPEPEQTKLF
jgi:DNA repair photolyase